MIDIVPPMRIQRHFGSLSLVWTLWTGASCTSPQSKSESAPEAEAEAEADTAPPSPADPPPLDLWDGVPALTPDSTDPPPPLKPRPGAQKPPSVHETIERPLAAPDPEAPAPPSPAEGPLRVERHGPIGPQTLVDAVRLTFNQPMIPLADIETLHDEPTPFTIEPNVPGHVQWMGTRTLAFIPEAGRMPFSTQYKVVVPAGTSSTGGQQLARDVRWSFSTAPLALVTHTPRDRADSVELKPTITLEFNQAIERNALVGAMTLSGRGDRMGLVLAPPPEHPSGVQPPPWQAARRIQVVPERALRPATRYTLTIPPGVYGEGLIKSRRLSLSWNTYAPLTLKKAKCWDPCWANQGIRLEANNLLSDPDIPAKVHITPEPEGFSVIPTGSAIRLSGQFEGRTRYKVTVDAGLQDIHGQSLGRDITLSTTLGPLAPTVALSSPTPNPAVIERAATPDLQLNVAGVNRVELMARGLSLPDTPAFFDAHATGAQREWPDDREPPTYTQQWPTPDALQRSESLTIDLGPALPPGINHVWLNLRSNAIKTNGWTHRKGLHTLVEITDLGVAAAVDRDSGVIMVNRLSTGAPVFGASVRLLDRTAERELWAGTTDAEGLAPIPSLDNSSGRLVVVEHQSDSAIVRFDRADLRGRWRYSSHKSNSQSPRAFFYTDRTPHKPGDTVHLAGILRNETHGPQGAIELWRTDFSAEYRVTSPRGIEVAQGTVTIGPMGTFSVDIPTQPDHGTGNFQFTLTPNRLLGSTHTFHHSFPVETYRTPEFTVAVERPTSTPLVFGERLVAQVGGEYLHGAALVGAQVEYVLRRSLAAFTPPGSMNEGFTFGSRPITERPYPMQQRSIGRGMPWRPSSPGRVIAQGSGALDARGQLRVEHPLLAIEPPPEGTPPDPSAPPPSEGPPPPATFTLEATVVDDNRQAIAAKGRFIVHAARAYVGLRSPRTVLREGERAQVEAILVDLEGERIVERPIALTLLRRKVTRTAVQQNGRWVYETKTENIEISRCALTSALVPTPCEFEVGVPGTYVVRSTAEDSDGHHTRSELELFVHGKTAVVWDSTERSVDLVPDRPSYAPGDTATVLVRSPFDEARGIVVVEREGIALKIPVVIKGGATTVDIPVDASMIPEVSIGALLTRGRVHVPGAPEGQDLGMPAAATGQVRIPVSTKEKIIELALEPSTRELSPGDTLTLTVRSTTADGSAGPAAVALMVVDEGVLSLMGHATPDPTNFFHHPREPDVWMYALHNAILPRHRAALGSDDEATPEADMANDADGMDAEGAGYGRGGRLRRERKVMSMAPAAEPDEMEQAAPMGSDEGRAQLDPSQAMNQPVSLREVFATTAYYNAEVLTDSSGQATVEIPMPENLTTFRIMAVAVDPNHADRFGSADTTVRVRKPIMVRPSLPRFANYGDHFEASVMVDNQSDEDQAIMVGTRGLNVKFPAETQTLLQIPAGTSREARFTMETIDVGAMQLQFAALSNGGRDATELSVPVHYPAVAEAFADYGMVEAATQRLIKPPNDALPGFGGLEISMSSTALSGLEDAVEYLVNYPYECAEQTASRILPIFALSTILDQFPIAGLGDKIVRDYLATQGIARLLDRQNPDGGFGYWERGESWPYLTQWVTLALLEGRSAGYTVEPKALSRALDYVEGFVTRGERTRWGKYYDWTSRAIGLWLLSGEQRGAPLFDRVWAHRNDMPLYARAMLMVAAHRYDRTSQRDTVLEQLRRAAVDSPRAVHFVEGQSESEADGLRVLMHSDVQTDAIVMMAMLEVAPTDPILPKVMAGIMAGRDPRRGGRWDTTHANAWALLAADRYLETVEADTPDYTARVWLDQQLSAEQAFKGRSMTSVEQHLPMAQLQGQAQRSLILGKKGSGKLYYRMGLRYAPKDLVVPAEDQGFVVYRDYEAIPSGDKKPDPRAVQKLDGGGWLIKAGTNVKVTLTVVARDRAHYVVVDDAIPAGFEGQNPRFLTSVAAQHHATQTPSPKRWWWPWWSFDHTDLRDERMLLFADSMPAGVYTYSYTARATTIGQFQLPPVKAEAMYEPERFGHSASSTVQIVP